MKWKQDGNKFAVTGFGHAFGKRARSMTSRFDFAVVEALRRQLLDGHFGCTSAGKRQVARCRAEFPF
jgi:hypothetical protein